MDRLVAMRTFVEIVDRGSLTAAAASTGRSLPTVVRVLSALEQHLGARLLQRTTRHMSLTEDGRNYLQRCRRILVDVEEAERAVGPAQGQPSGAVRMTAPVLFGQMHVVPTINGFLRRYPQVSVELELLDRVVNLVDEGFDLAVRIGRLADSTMVGLKVTTIRRVVCASPALLEQTGVPEHPSELTKWPCVRFRGIAPGSAWAFEERGRPLQVQVGGRFACNQAAAAAAACANGLGFGLFLAYQVQPFIEAGRLRTVLEQFEPAPLPVSLVYPGARLVSSRLRSLLDWLKRKLQVENPATERSAE